MAKTDWFKLCRPHLEWWNWDVDLDVERYAGELVDRAKRIHADTLAYCWESGGRLLYPGRHAPRAEGVGDRDLFGHIEREAHRQGLKFVACFLGVQGNTYMSDEHPEWVRRERDGELAPKWPGYTSRTLCPNSPMGDYLVDVAADLMRRYNLDGIYVEGITYGMGCYCSFCQERFRRHAGRDLPREGLEQDAEYLQFRLDTVTNFYRKLRAAIDATSPETVLFGCGYFPRDADMRALGRYVDVVTMECQSGYEKLADWQGRATLPEMGLMLDIMAAESKRPVLGTCWIAKHVDKDFAPRTPAHVQLNFRELLTHGGIAQVHTQNALEVDPTHMSKLCELYTNVEQLRPYLVDAQRISYAGILDWTRPADIGHYYDGALRGYYRALQEQHIPTSILTAEDLAAGVPGDLKVLVLPNAVQVSDAAAECIDAFVRSGGGLVMTYQSGLGSTRLSELAGLTLRCGGTGQAAGHLPVQTYYRITGGDPAWSRVAGRLLSFVGEYEEVACAPDVAVVADVLDFDYTRMSSRHALSTGWPGRALCPMIVTRQVGAGRVVYISGDLDAAAKRFGDADSLDVLGCAARWAGQEEPPYGVDCPPSVEIVGHRNPRGSAYLLLNHTTNPSLSEPIPDPIRYVVPIHAIGLRIKVGKQPPTRVTALSGQPLTCDVQGEWLSVKLEKLGEFEAIVVDQG